jgi:PilZ domain
MELTSAFGARRGAVAPPRIEPDRRRHKRYAVPLLGRFMRANKQEHACRLNDISVGGAAMMSPAAVEIGEHIIAYFDHLGRLEGSVVRTFDGGFAIKILATQHRREKLAAQITWVINQKELDESAQRRHERFRTTNKTSNLKLPDGVIAQVRVIDISMSGASVGTEARPPVGSEVVLGKLRARVARHHSEGLGLEFLDVQNREALRRHFG